jgi:hypothetical protein
MQQKTQEVVLARPTTKKPTVRRAPAARRAKAVEAPAQEAVNPPAQDEPVVEAAVDEAVSQTVEWPVGAAEKVEAPVTSASEAEPVEIEVTPQAELACEPAPAPVDVAPETPAAELQIEPPVTPEPAPQAADQTKGTFLMTDAMETAKTYAEEAKTRIQSAVTEMNEKAKTAMEKSAKAMEEMGDIAKGNLEAIVESSKIAAKGMESMGQEAVEFSRKSFENSNATFKKFAAIKSPTEFFQLQSELMSTAMDSFASEAAKSSEAMLKLAGDVSQPISNRVAIVTEKMKALAA